MELIQSVPSPQSSTNTHDRTAFSTEAMQNPAPKATTADSMIDNPFVFTAAEKVGFLDYIEQCQMLTNPPDLLCSLSI
ncbi:hypothetical protein CP533_3689 [Ophiocordyceps camponoti-saundersi (nom. inval.)]|nr:hypothetical protein CP533_3689 [Ophiocordyceps camponoti-saundersi (nom. inval.)]